jgi:polyhydroxyalkanoate synthesis regulator phasin
MAKERDGENTEAKDMENRVFYDDDQSCGEDDDAPLGFASKEWGLVKDSPNFPFMLIYELPGKGFVAHLREMTGYVKVIIQAASRFRDNALVKELIFNGEMNEEHGHSHYEDIYEVNESLDQYDRQVKNGEIFVRLREILDSRLDAGESEGYRDFLIDIAKGMTELSSEGFLGFGGKVSRKESEALASLKKWLGR